jgi:hypothetical protein
VASTAVLSTKSAVVDSGVGLETVEVLLNAFCFLCVLCHVKGSGLSVFTRNSWFSINYFQRFLVSRIARRKTICRLRELAISASEKHCVPEDLESRASYA